MKNKGFTFFDDNDRHWEWDNVNYGLTVANFDKINLSAFDTYNWNNTSLVLGGYGGLAFKTMGGSMFMHQNGIVSIGLNALSRDGSKIRALSKLSNSFGDVEKGYMLYVRQGIVTEKIKVALISNWPDYVFDKSYKLLPLSEVEEHISEKGHLPNIPSATAVQKEGIELGDMAKRQQEKIEEVFLHLIDMDKRLKALEAENAQLKAELDKLKK